MAWYTEINRVETPHGFPLVSVGSVSFQAGGRNRGVASAGGAELNDLEQWICFP